MMMKSKKLLMNSLDRKQKDESISLAQQQYLRRCQKEKRMIKFWQWFLMILFLGLWELGARTGVINDFVFSSPSGVVETMITMSKDGSLWYHTGITLAETFLSFLLIFVIGIPPRHTPSTGAKTELLFRTDVPPRPVQE